MRIFVCYSHQDKRFRKQLETHLRSVVGDRDLDVWVDTQIGVGQPWREEIVKALAAADVAILLVSADFRASKFIAQAELPAILRAAQDRGLRIVPIYVGRTNLSGLGFTELQGPNAPDRPLNLMDRARRDVVFADLVTELSQLAVREDRSPPGGPGMVTPDLAPTGGLLFDRAEAKRVIIDFLRNPTRRVCVLRGFPGIGKSALVAKVAEEERSHFQGLCWIRCREAEASADIVFAHLDACLQAGGDHSLRGLRQIKDEARRLDALVNATLGSLSRRPYLVVLDDFGTQLGPTHEIRDSTLSRLLEEFSSRGQATKMILVTDRRPAVNDRGALVPTGVVIEQEVGSLPVEAVRELMEECGVPVGDGSICERVAQRLSGNPTAIRMLCSLVTRQHLDPMDVLEQPSAGGRPFGTLLQRALSDLGAPLETALARLSVLRLPLVWEYLNRFELEREAVISLLDRSLLSFDAASHSVVMPDLVRRFVRDGMLPGRLAEEHAFVAKRYEALANRRGRDDLETARLRLEAGHHYFGSSNSEAGARNTLSAVELLVTFGYTRLAEENTTRVQTACAEAWAQAEASYQLGRIADQRGQLSDALERFVRALGRTLDERVRARCLFYIGRIHGARGELDAAERYLRESIALSERPDVQVPTAAAVLALAWIRKERGGTDEEALRAFKHVLDQATAQHDLISAGDAHRQIGFLEWDFHKRRDLARRHYGYALRFARMCSAVPQMAAIYNELGYLATEWDQPKRAMRYCSRAIEISRTIGDDYLMPGIYVNLGRAHWKRHDPETAREWLSKGVHAFKSAGNPGGEAYARHELARLLLWLQQDDAAREQLEIALGLCRANDFGTQLRSIEATLLDLIL